MSKIIQIKITAAKESSYWYADKIGEIYEVYSDLRSHKGEKYYGLVRDNSWSGVGVEDCIILGNFNMLKSHES